ncbi:Uncharacterised protein [Vibrio cholerae]|uniref:Uncharacterized protein n=1 Tax=Vibrio cholerae TaxID=666 RepID=A0A655XR92_VIBCL|nr:Uncharacterised protein [Vibrio cholerae]
MTIKLRDRFTNRFYRKGRQRFGKVGKLDARRERRLYITQFTRVTAFQEITDFLRRRIVSFAAQFISVSFQFTLQTNARQRIAWVILLRRNAHHNGAVSVTFGTRILAHTVGDNAPFFRRCCHHCTARTHTEAVHGAAIFTMVYQFVVCRAQNRVPRTGSKARFINHGLLVLNTKTDRERLGFHVYTAIVQHLKGITRTVADREHHVTRLDLFAVGECHAGDLPILTMNVINAGTKANFTAQFDDFCAHFFNHGHQFKGADVRLTHIQNLFWRARFNKLGDHFTAIEVRIFHLTVQLTIGKRTGTAFTKLHVRFGIQSTLTPKAEGIFGTLTHLFAALNDDRVKTHLRQH